MDSSGSFTTSDGVTIGYRRLGSGPPLLLVHGGVTDHRCFTPIFGHLAAHFTVTAYDRRGRGLSGTGADASLAREAADVTEAATHAGAGDPVSVIAYSYGATAALHAITTGPTPIRALVAYEAPFPVDGMLPEVDEILALVDARRYDDAVRLFVAGTFHLSPNAVQDKPLAAVVRAKAYLTRTLRGAASWRLDRSGEENRHRHGPLDHFGWEAP